MEAPIWSSPPAFTHQPHESTKHIIPKKKINNKPIFRTIPASAGGPSLTHSSKTYSNPNASRCGLSRPVACGPSRTSIMHRPSPTPQCPISLPHIPKQQNSQLIYRLGNLTIPARGRPIRSAAYSWSLRSDALICSNASAQLSGEMVPP